MGPAASAEEAIVRLLHEKKISNKINYEVLNDLKFTGVNRSPSKETTSSATVISNGEPVLNRYDCHFMLYRLYISNHNNNRSILS